MPALRVHHTDTSDAAWDGPANEARLRADEAEAYYRSAFAWQEADGDGTKKNQFRFIHHDVSSGGDVGAANVRAAVAGIGVLNGARGGTTIPDSDRGGVYRHLAAHLRDADIDPPELKSMKDIAEAHEHKTFTLDVKQFVPDEGTFDGYLSVYNVTDHGADVVEPGAFTKTIRDNKGRLVLRYEHQLDIGVLELTDSQDALHVKGTLNLDIPEAQRAYSMMKFLKRWEMKMGLSIGYRVVKDSLEKGIRRIKEARLFEGSLTCLPMNRLATVENFKTFGIEEKDFTSQLAQVQGWAIRYQLMQALDGALDEALYGEERTREKCIDDVRTALDDFQSAFMDALPAMLDSRGIKSRDLAAMFGKRISAQQVSALLDGSASTPDGAAPAASNGAANQSPEPEALHSELKNALGEILSAVYK